MATMHNFIRWIKERTSKRDKKDGYNNSKLNQMPDGCRSSMKLPPLPREARRTMMSSQMWTHGVQRCAHDRPPPQICMARHHCISPPHVYEEIPYEYFQALEGSPVPPGGIDINDLDLSQAQEFKDYLLVPYKSRDQLPVKLRCNSSLKHSVSLDDLDQLIPVSMHCGRCHRPQGVYHGVPVGYADDLTLRGYGPCYHGQQNNVDMLSDVQRSALHGRVEYVPCNHNVRIMNQCEHVQEMYPQAGDVSTGSDDYDPKSQDSGISSNSDKSVSLSRNNSLNSSAPSSCEPYAVSDPESPRSNLVLAEMRQRSKEQTLAHDPQCFQHEGFLREPHDQNWSHDQHDQKPYIYSSSSTQSDEGSSGVVEYSSQLQRVKHNLLLKQDMKKYIRDSESSDYESVPKSAASSCSDNDSLTTVSSLSDASVYFAPSPLRQNIMKKGKKLPKGKDPRHSESKPFDTSASFHLPDKLLRGKENGTKCKLKYLKCEMPSSNVVQDESEGNATLTRPLMGDAGTISACPEVSRGDPSKPITGGCLPNCALRPSQEKQGGLNEPLYAGGCPNGVLPAYECNRHGRENGNEGGCGMSPRANLCAGSACSPREGNNYNNNHSVDNTESSNFKALLDHTNAVLHGKLFDYQTPDKYGVVKCKCGKAMCSQKQFESPVRVSKVDNIDRKNKGDSKTNWGMGERPSAFRRTKPTRSKKAQFYEIPELTRGSTSSNSPPSVPDYDKFAMSDKLSCRVTNFSLEMLQKPKETVAKEATTARAEEASETDTPQRSANRDNNRLLADIMQLNNDRQLLVLF